MLSFKKVFKPQRHVLAVSVLSVSLLVGCSAIVRTPYQQPAVQIPAQYSQPGQATQAVHIAQLEDHWWTIFNDAELNSLVERALAANNNLAVAGLRLRQAREQAGLTANQQFPRVNASGSASHQVELSNGSDRSGGLNLSGSVSYAVDLWGKLANQTEAARWEAAATAQDLQSTAQTLVGTVCNLYWQLAYLNERIASSEASIANSRKLFQLVQAQYRAGAVSGLELAQAEQSLVGQEASQSQLIQQRVEARNALATLFDVPPAQLVFKEPQHLGTLNLPAIDAGLPAELLSRRPDLAAAELRLRKVLASKDATTASYYPSFSLTGSLGSSSTSLTELLKNPALTLGAGVSLPFLQYNDMQRNLAISELEYQAAIINFRQSLYSALTDVENALSNKTQLQTQASAQERTLSLAQRTEQLNEVRYRAGAVALKQWIDAQEARRNTQNSLLQIQLNQLGNMVTLMQSLGGRPLKQLP
ncbi:efflux transporter outer membrane subunit [Alkanindiges sp. WGS2144]|uniref:efflux transporter outer membrane subunit n=1 Tax=Alkanindiges sp. WGS2144 TaxID=3366808 RepID=UPI00375263EA